MTKQDELESLRLIAAQCGYRDENELISQLLGEAKGGLSIWNLPTWADIGPISPFGKVAEWVFGVFCLAIILAIAVLVFFKLWWLWLAMGGALLLLIACVVAHGACLAMLERRSTRRLLKLRKRIVTLKKADASADKLISATAKTDPTALARVISTIPELTDADKASLLVRGDADFAAKAMEGLSHSDLLAVLRIVPHRREEILWRFPKRKREELESLLQD